MQNYQEKALETGVLISGLGLGVPVFGAAVRIANRTAGPPHFPLPVFRVTKASYLELLQISVMISDHELRSLGIKATGKSKRKRNPSFERSGKWRKNILRTNTSDLSAPAMNQSSDIFVEFSAKIRRVLECPDPDVVLRALRDLAEGRAASMLGTEVDSLSGLGQQTFGNVPNSDYRETMTTLLTWGMRSFLIQPSLNATHLWTSMAKLDGRKGYAQRQADYGTEISTVNI
jgi:hypothetical protein